MRTYLIRRLLTFIPSMLVVYTLVFGMIHATPGNPWDTIKDRYPDLIAEVRGEGLLVGLRAVVPAGELVNAIRAEKMLTVAAGDNVVRLLPPLIITEQEIDEGVTRLDRACAKLSRAAKHPAAPAQRKAETAE